MLMLLLFACAGDDGGSSATCSVDAEAGTAVATVDGAAWTGEGATWLWAGESLQINTVGNGSWWMSMIAQTTPDGDTLKAAVDADSFPITLSLSSNGWATLYPDSGDSFSSRDGGGDLEILEADGTVVRGCFSFEASGDGGSVVVEDGTFEAEAG